MRRLAVSVLVVAFAVVVPTGGATHRTSQQFVGPPASIVQYGYVRTVTRTGTTYRLRFDPALWLTGSTAQRAAVEDGVLGPGEPVPNDYYIRNESKRQLTYVLPRTARVTVVTTSPAGLQRSTRVTVDELAALTKGRNPRGLKLYGRNLGYWARIVIDRVVALDQQYQP
ncbi:MAG TPA: hypothetical protein VFU99_03130 [Gaiellaceae bacterium]|nr:hypothetical protein [Gaiellaceae bacterium]